MGVLGFRRMLQASDLWCMGPEHETAVLTAQLEAAWARRVAAVAQAPPRRDRPHHRLLCAIPAAWSSDARPRLPSRVVLVDHLRDDA
ncbi:hypothetical protein B0H12DRAFT_1093026 [Mycena haematopus]|nr:hypothetical protein B0H12DRAFT_1093026 [Mycena haematopus]